MYGTFQNTTTNASLRPRGKAVKRETSKEIAGHNRPLELLLETVMMRMVTFVKIKIKFLIPCLVDICFYEYFQFYIRCGAEYVIL
jgi:hypothetical protein